MIKRRRVMARGWVACKQLARPQLLAPQLRELQLLRRRLPRTPSTAARVCNVTKRTHDMGSSGSQVVDTGGYAVIIPGAILQSSALQLWRRPPPLTLERADWLRPACTRGCGAASHCHLHKARMQLPPPQPSELPLRRCQLPSAQESTEPTAARLLQRRCHGALPSERVGHKQLARVPLPALQPSALQLRRC